ncbi:MAG: TolC family protein [Hydrogenothermaceae bacterium]|nr:TolC family protein [Hydrogenothermaceae bacterium]
MIFFISILVVLLSLKPVYAETVEEIINLAKLYNPDIKRIEKEVEVLKQKSKTAGRLPNPSFSFSIKDSGNFTVFQYIPWYEKLQLQKEIEEKRYESQMILLKQEKSKILRQIIENALYIQFYREKIAINNQALELIDNILHGSITETDKSKLLIFKTGLVLENQDLKLLVSKLISDIRVLVNYDIKDVEIKPFNLQEIDQEELREKVKKFSLSVKYIEKQIERDRLSYKLAKEIFMPDFGISVTYKSKDRFQDAFSMGVNLYVNVPVWKRLNQEQIVLEQKLQLIASEEKRVNVINQTIWSLDKLIQEYNYSKEKLKLVESSIKTYETDLNLTVHNFLNGKETINNLLYTISENISIKNRKNQEILSATLSFFKILEIFGEI